MRRSLAILVVLSLLTAPVAAASQAVWDGSASSRFPGGCGTPEDPCLIASPGQLARFRDLVNGGQPGLCGKLVTDLDLGGLEWTPIGLSGHGYTGCFDGRGKAIRNMRITRVSAPVSYQNRAMNRTERSQVGGLFGVVGAEGVVKNVCLSGQVTGEVSGVKRVGIYLGGIAGCVFGRVERCFSTCDFTGLSLSNNDFVGLGGVAGLSQGGSAIRNCYAVGSMNVEVATASPAYRVYLGGISGYQMGELENCYAVVPISVSSNSKRVCVGGVTGLTACPSAIQNSYYDAQVCSGITHCAGGTALELKGVNPTGCRGLGTSSMTIPSFVDTLGSAYCMDIGAVNRGYPILWVMTGSGEVASAWYQEELEQSRIDRSAYERLFPDELRGADLTRPITRVEFAAVAVHLYEALLGEEISLPEKSPFRDTRSQAAVKAWQVGITNGVDETGTRFDPRSFLTRQDLAAMLTRVYQSLYLEGWSLERNGAYTLERTGSTVFRDDSQISDYAKPAVYFLVDQGILRGISPEVFAPRDLTEVQEAEAYASASREQALFLAIRAFQAYSASV